MDPDSPHTDPPAIKVRAPETGPLPAHEPQSAAPVAAPSGAAVKRVRPNALMVAGIALLAIGLVSLVGLATWSYLSKQQDPGVTTDAAGVPQNAIALINSSTPIPLQLPPGATDGAGAIGLQPPSEQWSPALREAHKAEDEGRYSSAISLYASIIGAGRPDEARDALWGLASSYAAAGQRDLALRTYSVFAGLDDPRAPAAYVRAGQLHEEMAHFADASQVYSDYARLRGPASNAVKLMQAHLLGDDPRAEGLYNEVINSNPLDPDLREALSRLADFKAKRGDHAGARRLYEQLAAIQEKDSRPLLDNQGRPPEALAADEAVAAGDQQGAVKELVGYINRPAGYAYGRYSALQTLVKIEPTVVDSGTIAPMLAARIAFDAGYYGDSIGYMDTLRTVTPDSSDRPTAALLTGRAFDLSGDSVSAYNWYTATVQVYPNSPQAPEAIRRAGDALADQSQWDAALATYSQTVATYPNAGDQVALARIHGSVLAYRLGDRDTAVAMITPLVSVQLSPDLKTQALFWAAKLQKSGGDNAWRDTIKPISTLSPSSYLDFRARSLLAGEPDGGPIIGTYTATNAITPTVNYDAEAQERDELLSWAATLTSTRQVVSPTISPAATSTITLTESLQPTLTPSEEALVKLESLPEAHRAAALLELGFEPEANTAFRALANKLYDEGDPSTLAALMIYLRYNATPYLATRASIALSSMYHGDPLKQPSLLLKTLYPMPYYDLVQSEAQQRNIDPMVLYALIRQESQFVPNALSGADARGLTQIIPSTGEGIAQQLGDTSYTADELYLPYVNVRYGAYYLASTMPQFDRKLFPTLAAYNGGPGNAARWLQGSALTDPDLFLERVDLFETADYLQIVYSNYWFYRLTYQK